MRILILGHYEIASNYAISRVVDSLHQAQQDYDIRIALSGRGDKKLESRSEQNDFQRLAQYERKLCDELDAGQDNLGLACKGFNQLGRLIGKPIQLLVNPNSEKGLSKLTKWDPDLIVSIRYRKIFRDEAISIPNRGVINLHSGLLPEYRGTMATFWSMLRKEQVYGSTLHYISDKSIDTGAIIKRISQKLDYQKSYLENVLALYPSGCEAIIETINIIQSNGRLDVQIPKNTGKYFSFPSLDDLILFNNESNNLY